MADTNERKLIGSQMRRVIQPAIDLWAADETDRRTRDEVVIAALIDAGWRPTS